MPIDAVDDGKGFAVVEAQKLDGLGVSLHGRRAQGVDSGELLSGRRHKFVVGRELRSLYREFLSGLDELLEGPCQHLADRCAGSNLAGQVIERTAGVIAGLLAVLADVIEVLVEALDLGIGLVAVNGDDQFELGVGGHCVLLSNFQEADSGRVLCEMVH
jgi:hypothetical protein